MQHVTQHSLKLQSHSKCNSKNDTRVSDYHLISEQSYIIDSATDSVRKETAFCNH